MGGFSLWHWLVVGIIILLLFGKGRFSDMMGDVAKGIKSFKKGMSDEDEAAAQAPRRIADDRAAPPPQQPVAGHNADVRAVDPQPVDPLPVRPVQDGSDRREP